MTKFDQTDKLWDGDGNASSSTSPKKIFLYIETSSDPEKLFENFNSNNSYDSDSKM